MDKLWLTHFRSKYSLFFLLSCLLVYIFFRNVPAGSFLFLHDEYLPFPGHEANQQFQIRTFLDLGASGTFQLVVTFFDRVFYWLSYKIGFGIEASQVIFYWIKLVTILVVPAWGFEKLANKFLGSADEAVVLVISLWYAFNTYTVIFWHGNGFSYTLLLCYSLAPVSFYFWNELLLPDESEARGGAWVGQLIIKSMYVAVVLFFMSFALYLFAPFFLFLLGYTFLVLLFSRHSGFSIALRLLILAACCLPLFSVHLMVLYEMFFLSAGAQNTTGNETFGNLSGGLLYMQLMWFAWPIYVFWTPRNVWTFSEYYKTLPALAAPILLYGQIFWAWMRRRQTTHFFAVAILLLIFLFMAKGPQEPFGEIYLFLLKNVPGFRVFRSPDSKFGFVIIFSIAILSLLSSSTVSKGKFLTLIVGVMLIQSYPLLTGLAIVGENSTSSRDRIVHIPEDYREVESFFSTGAPHFGYVASFPAVDFARFSLGERDEHTGQDILAKLVKYPFVYGADGTGMARETFEKYDQAIRTRDFRQLRNYGVRYYVIRRDVIGSRFSLGEIQQFLSANYRQVLKNRTFTVFEDVDAPALFASESSVSFDLSNYPLVRLVVDQGHSETKLEFHQSFHPSWRLYLETDASDGNRFGVFDYLFYVWRIPLISSPRPGKFYSNNWSLPPNNSDSVKQNYSIVYWPQALFAFLTVVSGSVLCCFLLLIGSYRWLANRALDLD